MCSIESDGTVPRTMRIPSQLIELEDERGRGKTKGSGQSKPSRSRVNSLTFSIREDQLARTIIMLSWRHWSIIASLATSESWNERWHFIAGEKSQLGFAIHNWFWQSCQHSKDVLITLTKSNGVVDVVPEGLVGCNADCSRAESERLPHVTYWGWRVLHWLRLAGRSPTLL